MKNTNKKIEEADNTIRQGFSLIESYEIVDRFPPAFRHVREERKEIYEFFDKIPEDKVMKIRFPNEGLWKTYFMALRYYASEYTYDMQFKKEKAEGYFVYIRKIKKGVI